MSCFPPQGHSFPVGAATAGTLVISDLNDVDTSGVADGDYLHYDQAGGEWVAGPILVSDLPAHEHDGADITSGTVAITYLPVASSGTVSTTQLVRADDSRLSDSRTPLGPAGGDLSGTYPDPTVVGLQTRPVSSALPTAGQVLTWNDSLSQWEPDTPSAGATTFDALDDTDTTGLASGDSIKWNGTDWVPYTLTDDYYTSTEVDDLIADSLREHILSTWWNNLAISGVGASTNGGGTGGITPDSYGARVHCGTTVDSFHALSAEMMSPPPATPIRWSAILRADPEESGWTTGHAFVGMNDDMHLTNVTGATGIDRQVDHAGVWIDAIEGDIFSDPYLQVSSGETGVVQSTQVKTLSGWGGARVDDLIAFDAILGTSVHFYDAASGLVATHTTAVPSTLTHQEAIVSNVGSTQHVNIGVRSSHLRYGLVS